MSLQFLSPNGAVAFGPRNTRPPARSAMLRQARAAGVRARERDGWLVPVELGAGARERRRDTVAFADASHLAVIELCEPRIPALRLGMARCEDGVWWCPITPRRVLAVCAGAQPSPSLLTVTAHSRIELTGTLAGLRIAGPLARETIARFCALDLRPAQAPAGAFRPGSVARTPGAVLCESEDVYLVLFGWAFADYMWTIVADAADHLRGGPVGLDEIGGEVGREEIGRDYA